MTINEKTRLPPLRSKSSQQASREVDGAVEVVREERDVQDQTVELPCVLGVDICFSYDDRPRERVEKVRYERLIEIPAANTASVLSRK